MKLSCKKGTRGAFLQLTNGAGDEARTRYLHLGKVALYQMSYTRRLQAAKPLQLRQNPIKRF